MESYDSRPSFSIRLQIIPQDEASKITDVHNDVISCTIYRCPLAKTISYFEVIFNIPPQELILYKESIAFQIFLPVSFQIVMVDESKVRRDGLLEDESISHEYYTSSLTMLDIYEMQPIKNDMIYVQAKAILVNPVLLFLHNNNPFSAEVKFNMSPLQMLNDFEEYIKQNHGDIFWTHRVVNTEFENNYTLKQVLPKLKSDIEIPNMLINNYKAYNSYGIYFFDDFCLDKDNDKFIALHYINFSDLDKFKEIDLTDENNKDVGVLFGLEIEKIKLINDPFGRLTNIYRFHEPDEFKFNLVIHGPNESIYRDISNKDYYPSGEFEHEIINEEFPKKVFRYEMKQSENSGKIHKIIYAPDSFDNAIIRYHTVSKQLRDLFYKILKVKVEQCLPHTFQFGYVYNIEGLDNDETSEDGGRLTKTPIGIINKFVRTGKVPILKHKCELHMLQMFNI